MRSENICDKNIINGFYNGLLSLFNRKLLNGERFSVLDEFKAF